jgi:SPX domain protein involved in polyphosphate accumulation
MKFGEYLLTNMNKDWEDKYLDYEQLDKMITVLEERHIGTLQVCI